MAVEGNNVGFNLERNYGSGRLRELLHDEHLGAAKLEEEKEKRVPYDTLEDDDLDHERSGVLAVHGDQERDPHDERVGERGEGEDCDAPLEAPGAGEVSPEDQEGEHEDFLEGVCCDETEVHGVRVVGGDEVEREERDGEDGDETVYSGALVGGEDFPPPYRAVGEDHSDVEGNHGREDRIEVVP